MHGSTHIAGNRLDLVMPDVPDTVDVVVGTPLGISDHCFVSSVLRVEQSVERCQTQCREDHSTIEPEPAGKT